MGKQIFSLGSFPEVGQKQKTKKTKKILQGLGVDQAAVIKRWLLKAEKSPKIIFFSNKNKNYNNKKLKNC